MNKLQRLVAKLEAKREAEAEAKRQLDIRPAVPPRIQAIAAMVEIAKRAQVSREETPERQRKLVEGLLTGGRVSLGRCYKLAGYARHRPSLASLLEQPGVVALFRAARDAGRPLPRKFERPIRKAIRIQEEIALGIRRS